MSHKCKCNPGCTTVVKTHNLRYAHGHSPACVRTRFTKGFTPWNKGTKGAQVAWNKGLTKETNASVAKCGLGNKGKKNPWMSYFNTLTKKGTHLSKRRRKEISKCMKKARRTYAPIWNKGLTKETSSIVRKLGRTLSRVCKGIPKPHVSKQGIRRFWYCGKNGTKIKMRSRWEVHFANYLDALHVYWLYEAFTFVMNSFSYTPDFYIVQLDTFVEIKGYEGDGLPAYKRHLLRARYCCNLITLREHNLNELGVFDCKKEVMPYEHATAA